MVYTYASAVKHDPKESPNVVALCCSGNAMSIRVMTDDTGKSRGFGFVSFERHEDAQKVRDELLSFFFSPCQPHGNVRNQIDFLAYNRLWMK